MASARVPSPIKAEFKDKMQFYASPTNYPFNTALEMIIFCTSEVPS